MSAIVKVTAPDGREKSIVLDWALSTDQYLRAFRDALEGERGLRHFTVSIDGETSQQAFEIARRLKHWLSASGR